jgi:threonine dehydrogenase-like Zn-dependent dehydrogenase
MKAILKNDNRVEVKSVPEPVLRSPNDVLIHIAVAGLCRTDVYVADGLIKCKNPLILGHEFSGTIVQTGTEVDDLHAGDRVTVMPFFSPDSGEQHNQPTPQKPKMLGVDYDGAFTEYIVVPAHAVYKVPDSMHLKTAAYMEPVAASLGCANANIQPDSDGMIYGDNRISRLTERVLKAKGFNNIQVIAEQDAMDMRPMYNQFDYIIETIASDESMKLLINAVKPGGLIVIKSRRHTPVGLNFNSLVHKDITLQAVNYGDFSEGIELVASGSLKVDDLFGKTHQLEDFHELFRRSRQGEAKKMFLTTNNDYAD